VWKGDRVGTRSNRHQSPLTAPRSRVPLAVPQRVRQGKSAARRDGSPSPVRRRSTMRQPKAFVETPRSNGIRPDPVSSRTFNRPSGFFVAFCMVEARPKMTRRGPRSKLVPSCVATRHRRMNHHTVAVTRQGCRRASASRDLDGGRVTVVRSTHRRPHSRLSKSETSAKRASKNELLAWPTDWCRQSRFASDSTSTGAKTTASR